MDGSSSISVEPHTKRRGAMTLTSIRNLQKFQAREQLKIACAACQTGSESYEKQG
jgi:hypothetical protein